MSFDSEDEMSGQNVEHEKEEGGQNVDEEEADDEENSSCSEKILQSNEKQSFTTTIVISDSEVGAPTVGAFHFDAPLDLYVHNSAFYEESSDDSFALSVRFLDSKRKLFGSKL